MYITNSNLRRLLSKVEPSKDYNEINIKNDVIKDILSIKDIKNLSGIQAFFLGKSVKISELNPIRNVDSLRYVNEGNKPAFHKNKECIRANQDFIGYLIPDEIRIRGTDEIHRYRREAREIDFNNQAECIALAAKFNIKLETVSRARHEVNAGVGCFEVYNIENLSILKLDEKLEELSILIRRFEQEGEQQREIYNLRFIDAGTIQWVMSDREDNLPELANQLAQYKKNVMRIIEQKSKKESGFDQEKIAEDLLLKLNFVPCQTCLA